LPVPGNSAVCFCARPPALIQAGEEEVFDRLRTLEEDPKMEKTPKHPGWKLNTNRVLLVLNKLLLMGIAWLFFFHLVLAGWDLQVQEEQPRQTSLFENYESAPPITLKGGIEE
jgi:hypothetical protein